MNKRTIIITAGCYILGAVTGALAVDRVWEKRFNREIDEAATKIKMDYARYYAGEDGKPTIASLGIQTMTPEEFQQEAEKVVRSVKERVAKPPTDYTALYTGGSEEHPIMDLGAAQSLIQKTAAQSEAIKDEMGYEGIEEDEDDKLETHNVFEDNPLPPDFENRTDGGVYILTTEEFMEEPRTNGYETVSVTWFEYDNTLIDETDGKESIISIEDTITEGVLRHFGWHPKGEKDTIFVRNEKSQIDFEVTRDERSYAEAIAGFTEEDEKRPRRKRPEDD